MRKSSTAQRKYVRPSAPSSVCFLNPMLTYARGHFQKRDDEDSCTRKTAKKSSHVAWVLPRENQNKTETNFNSGRNQKDRRLQPVEGHTTENRWERETDCIHFRSENGPPDRRVGDNTNVLKAIACPVCQRAKKKRMDAGQAARVWSGKEKGAAWINRVGYEYKNLLWSHLKATVAKKHRVGVLVTVEWYYLPIHVHNSGCNRYSNKMVNSTPQVRFILEKIRKTYLWYSEHCNFLQNMVNGRKMRAQRWLPVV
jgi:hypothetical protein